MDHCAEEGVEQCRVPQPTSARTTRVSVNDVLVIPHHKRLSTSYERNEAGQTELHMYFGEIEIVFDEPDLFAFGEGLATHARFVAGSAATWGEGHEWQRVRTLLETLLEEGLLKRAAQAGAEPPRAQGLVPSPLPPSTCTVPGTWADCESIMLGLTGRALQLGHLELVVPIYRVAHLAMDTEGRQVGEANVFPAPLRVDVLTEWRTCQHAGSRYQDEQPMNVSALRSMVKHWKPAMVLLLRLRTAYLDRFPDARHGFTIGDMQRLTSLVLAVPAYLLMRREQPVPTGQLDPVLSSLFRVTDGVRMVMHRMLFTADNEPSRAPNTPISGAEIYAYSERNTAFLSDHGVCAGPKMMIEEFLRVLVDGQPVGSGGAAVFSPQVDGALRDLDAAFAYGLLGLQAYAVVFSLWPQMARAYERLWSLADTPALRCFAPLQPLRELLRRAVQYLRSATRLKNEEQRLVLEHAYADMYARSAQGLRETNAADALPARLASACAGRPEQTRQRLLALLSCPEAARDQRKGLAAMAQALADYLAQEQAVVRVAAEVQQHINRLLGRTPPSRPLAAIDLALHYRLVAFHYQDAELQQAGGRLPYLVDDLCEAFGLRVRVTADGIDLGERAGADVGP